MTLSDFIGAAAHPEAPKALSLWAGLLVLWLVLLYYILYLPCRNLKI